MRYRLSAVAEQDLLEAWVHVAAAASIETADRVLDHIIRRFELLTDQPGLGRLRPEYGIGVRSSPVDSYVIYYRVEDAVLIARVLHGRRDQLAAWRGETAD
ncbi:MAG: type II toxin-antitoxin system RelE/ParE family toxin [Vicinamibacterales bacterium]